MTPFKDFTIYLLDINPDVCHEWYYEFKDEYPNVHIINADFEFFMKNYEVDAIVSPANSFGLMTGGYDKAIRDYLSTHYSFDVIDVVQSEIMRTYDGEQPVGTAMSVYLNDAHSYLIHTPSMRVPSVIVDPEVVYHCTRASILESMVRNCRSVVLPAFGGATGKVPYEVIAYYMKRALDTFAQERVERPTWKYIYNEHPMHELDNKRFAQSLLNK
jgi:O-acetyl-ADP-ribose deacetylase (regulator of RNase III)